MRNILRSYGMFIKSRLQMPAETAGRDLTFWQDFLFYNFLLYCLPVSLVALVPGVYIALQTGSPLIAACGLACFFIIALLTFSASLSLVVRKSGIVLIFYLLAVYLITAIGYMVPGIFFLSFVTMLIALIFPIRYAYWSVALMALVLFAFAVIIRFGLFDSPLSLRYTPGLWLAFSAIPVFASIILIVLVAKIFQGLQLTITGQSQLEERYKSIFDNSPLPMWLFDTETLAFVDINEAAIRHYGYSREEFLSMSIRDIRTAEGITKVENIVRDNKVSGAYYDAHSRHIKKNGELINVRIESNLLTIEGRQVRIVLSTDITAQIQSQLDILEYNRRLRESESDLRAIFDSAAEGFVLLDANYRVKTFNERAQELMRFNNDQGQFATGRSVYDFVKADKLPEFKALIRQVYAGNTTEYERSHQAADGNEVWIRYTLIPVSEGDQVTGACIHGRDITVRRLYLKNLEEQNEIFREIGWMQSHLVRAPLVRIMALMPLFTTAASPQEQDQIKSFLDESVRELDAVILQITEKSAQLKKSSPQRND